MNEKTKFQGHEIVGKTKDGLPVIEISNGQEQFLRVPAEARIEAFREEHPSGVFEFVICDTSLPNTVAVECKVLDSEGRFLGNAIVFRDYRSHNDFQTAQTVAASIALAYMGYGISHGVAPAEEFTQPKAMDAKQSETRKMAANALRQTARIK